MADILIKNMELPKDFTEGLIITITGGIAYDVTHCKELEAIELPSHGRLVDADKLEKSLISEADFPSYEWSRAVDLIRNAPVVVEATT